MLYGLLFANGDPNDGPAVQAAINVPDPRLIIAADGGVYMARHFGLHPHLVIGDMDSASPEALAEAEAHGAEIQRFPAAKDETDLELALLEAAARNCDPIRVIGTVGDRLDQTLGNVYLLSLPALRERDVKLVSHAQTSWLAYPGRTRIEGSPGDTLSLLPLTSEATDILTEGLVYPLKHETLYIGPARGMSNVLEGREVWVSFASGLLLMVHTMGRA